MTESVFYTRGKVVARYHLRFALHRSATAVSAFPAINLTIMLIYNTFSFYNMSIGGSVLIY